MKISIKTKFILPTKIDILYDALKSPKMMQTVAWPMVYFQPVEPKDFPEKWENGSTYKMNMDLFGFMPIGWQVLNINSSYFDQEAVLSDIGPGFAVKLWDHKVLLKKHSETETLYDEVLYLTVNPLVAPMMFISMKILFWWRKIRWGMVVDKL
jgi:hypothetical protein